MRESKFDVEAVQEKEPREQRGFSSPAEEFQLVQAPERKTSKCIFVSVFRSLQSAMSSAALAKE